MPSDSSRELVLTVALPEDRGRRGDARPKVHRFRSHWAELGRRLRAFRDRYGVTQAEVARAVGAEGHSTVALWERGGNVPEGLRRERLVELLEGRRWPELRAATLVGDGLPGAWGRGARWYRRASRGRVPRATVGAVVAAMLEELRTAASPAALRQRYGERDGGWAQGRAARAGARPGAPGRRAAPRGRGATACAGWSWRTGCASTCAGRWCRSSRSGASARGAPGARRPAAPKASVGPETGRSDGSPAGRPPADYP